MHKKASVILYSRPACHLCKDAREQMLSANCADAYDFEEINIDADPVLVERYRLRVPVICINGKEAFEIRVTADAFKKAVMTKTK